MESTFYPYLGALGWTGLFLLIGTITVSYTHLLREMAAGKPTSREAMLGIAGVGERKLAQYGDAFLAVIARYISEN